MKRLRRTRGFTLMEVMVVVTIVGILASIAIPVFLRFQYKTKRAERPALVNAMARGVMDYVERNGRLPTATSATDSVIACDWNPPRPVTGARKVFDHQAPCWNELAMKAEGTVYHHFFISGALSAGVGSFTVQTDSDLDADGLPSNWQSTYQLMNGSWQLVSDGPPTPPAPTTDDW